MAENGQIVKSAKMKKLKLPKFMTNRVFIFISCLVLFLLSFFTLLCIDTENAIRPSFLDFLLPLLKNMNLMFDVNMATWFLFFLIFGTLFVLFFIFMFYKNMKKKRAERIFAKKDREPTKGEVVRFNILFFAILFVLLLAGIIGVFVFFHNTNDWFQVIGRQLGEGAKFAGNFFISLGLVLGFMSIVPILFLILLLIFKFFIFIISLIVSGVSSAIMQSESYQKNVAASQAAAQDIASSMREARKRAGEAVDLANSIQNGGGKRSSPTADILFPALTNIDIKWAKIEEEKQAAKKAEEDRIAEIDKQLAEGKITEEQALTLKEPEQEIDPNERPALDYEQFKIFVYEFQSYLAHQKYYFEANVLRSFIAGLSAARLILLEGLSGTGKSTLPRVFLEYVGGDAYFFPVQATWRDRSDITGYYSDFTGQFKETELLKHLYEASYITDDINLMVLDEMNISRVEYYFADFLSIFEYPAEDWVVPLMQVKPGTVLPKHIENGMVRIPKNTWFVGTVNIDDSTFTITDKVYDRAIVIDFQHLNKPFETTYRFDRHPITVDELTNMFEICKAKPENNLTEKERKQFMDLCEFINDVFDIQFGNRIMNQVDNFLPVFVGLGGSKTDALDIMFARKILRKLDGKFESYIKDGLMKLTRYINTTYGRHVLKETEELIEKYRRKLS